MESVEGLIGSSASLSDNEDIIEGGRYDNLLLDLDLLLSY